MRNLLRFIIQYHFLILFLLFEIFSLFILFSANPYQKVKYYSFSHRISGRMSKRVENVKDYLALHGENRKLAAENARLNNQLNLTNPLAVFDTSAATAENRLYTYYPARVINNTVNKQYNFLTLDRGAKSNLIPDMAVISNMAVVGIVSSVSDNYATVLSVINRDFRISGKIKKNGYFGPVYWTGNHTEKVTMVDIPHHVDVAIGDTIVTSGFGGIFPEGYLIGVVDQFRLKGGNYFEITIRLANDFRKLNYVQVIGNLHKPEIDSLQNSISQ